MSEQINLFYTQEVDNTLEVVEMAFLDKKYTNAEELFSGFDKLYAITFSYGLDFINKIVKNFEYAEIIIGCEATVKFDLKTIMAFQQSVLKRLPKYDYLAERASNDTLVFHVAKDIISHQKIFILTSKTGKTRIIWGSANFSGRPFSGNQRENIGYFENDINAYDFYMNEFETLLSFSTCKIEKEAFFFNKRAIKEPDIEDLPIIKEIRERNAGIILESNPENDDIAEFTYDINSLSENYAKALPKLQKEDGKILISPAKVTELLRKHKKIMQEQTAKQTQHPQFQINYDEGTVYFNQKPYSFDVNLNDVKQDLLLIDKYFAGFDNFIGDAKLTKRNFFRLMNYCFLSPFIAHLRYVAHKNEFSPTLFPLYAVMNGPKSAGKSTFMDTIHTIMFGRPLGGVDPADFTKTRIYAHLHECTGVPLHIEDIVRKNFNEHAGEIVKYDAGILKERLINHPVFIFTSNDIDTIKSDYAKRVCYLSVDAQLTNVTAAFDHKKVAELRKRITTSFYKEYFKRMYSKVTELLEQMNVYEVNEAEERWEPDIFAISSNTILEIYRDCDLQAPEHVTETKYEDYFGENVIIESVREKIIFEWTHNRSAFKVLKKQNRLEYTAGERAYEATKIQESLPEKLRAKCSGNKVVMLLDAANEFFGIQFKNKLF